MFPLQEKIGVKSYSFKTIKNNRDVADAITQCNAATVDLSGCHVNYDDREQQEETVAIYREAGIEIAGIGVVQTGNDEAQMRRFFDFARLAGCGLVSVNFPPEEHVETVRLVGKLCDEYGVRAAIHNHGGKHWLGTSVMASYVFGLTSPSVGLCLDTAWCIDSGEDPVEWLDRFGDRLYGVHFKDFTYSRDRIRKDEVVGEGILDLPAFLAAFKKMPNVISAVVEYEGQDALDATKASIEAIRGEWAKTT